MKTRTWLLPVFRCARWLFTTAVTVPVMAMVIGMAVLSGFSLEKTVGLVILIAKAQPLELSETTRQAFVLKTLERYADRASQTDVHGRPYPFRQAYRPADAARVRAMDHDEDAALEAGKPIAEILWKIYFALATLSFCASFFVSTVSHTAFLNREQ